MSAITETTAETDSTDRVEQTVKRIGIAVILLSAFAVYGTFVAVVAYMTEEVWTLPPLVDSALAALFAVPVGIGLTAAFVAAVDRRDLFYEFTVIVAGMFGLAGALVLLLNWAGVL